MSDAFSPAFTPKYTGAEGETEIFTWPVGVALDHEYRGFLAIVRTAAGEFALRRVPGAGAGGWERIRTLSRGEVVDFLAGKNQYGPTDLRREVAAARLRKLAREMVASRAMLESTRKRYPLTTYADARREFLREVAEWGDPARDLADQYELSEPPAADPPASGTEPEMVSYAIREWSRRLQTWLKLQAETFETAVRTGGPGDDVRARRPDASTACLPADGPGDPFLFRWAGREIDLSDASLERRLLAVLWDGEAGKPRPPVDEGALMAELYPDEDEAEEKMKGLVKRIRGKMTRSGLGCTLKRGQSCVWIAVRPAGEPSPSDAP